MHNKRNPLPKIAGELIEIIKPIDSTQLEADRTLAVKKPPFVIVAESQTSGYGRFGEKWLSPQGGIYFTWVTDYTSNPSSTLVIALCIAKTIEPYSQGQVKIKWPNDVLLNGKKVSGSIVEVIKGHLLVGVGINTCKSPEPNMFAAMGLDAEQKWKVFFDFFKNLNIIWPKYTESGFSSVLPYYNKFALPFGTVITTFIKGKPYTGAIMRISDRGSLFLRTSDGIIELFSGSITTQQEN